MDDAVWLVTERQVENGDVDTDGFMLLPAGAKLADTGLSAAQVERTIEENQKAVIWEGPVNVLVKVPTLPLIMEPKEEEIWQSGAKRQRVDTLEWKWMEDPPRFNLQEGTMFFVGRDGATEQLQDIHKNPISQIIERTFIHQTKMITIKTHFCLDDERVTEVADHLFKTTLGHPRSLIRAFKQCHSYDELIAYDATGVRDCIDWAAFAERMQRYAKPLEKLMSFAIRSAPINLAQVWEDKGGDDYTYDIIANSFGIAWDGTLVHAAISPAPDFGVPLPTERLPYQSIILPPIARLPGCF